MPLHVEPTLTDNRHYSDLFGLLPTGDLPTEGAIRRGRRLGFAGPLAAAALYRAAADELLTRIVADYVEAGWTLEQIGESLGVSKQAVAKRHGRRSA